MSALALWLRQQGHAVFSVYDAARGISDDAVLEKAFSEEWILITNDKDFGDKVYRDRHPHHGVIVLRLQDERTENKINCLERLLRTYSERLFDHFVVVTEKQIRFAGK
jgi:predicted nuclease of predicted toxin-antitoxin system